MPFQVISPRPCRDPGHTHCYRGRHHHVREEDCLCLDGYQVNCSVPQHASRAQLALEHASAIAAEPDLEPQPEDDACAECGEPLWNAEPGQPCDGCKGADPRFEEIDDGTGLRVLALRPVGDPDVDSLAAGLGARFDDCLGARFDDFGRPDIEQAWVLPLSCRKTLAEAGIRARLSTPELEGDPFELDGVRGPAESFERLRS